MASISLYINLKTRSLHKNAYDPTRITELDLRAGDTPTFNLYFMLPMRDPRAPYAITRFQTATISMQLLDAGKTAQATQASWTELAPATTAPATTTNQAPSSTKGLDSRTVLASEPGSGHLLLKLSGGTIQSKGAGSATAKIYPGISTEAEVAAAFAGMIGAPYSIAFGAAGAQGGPTIIDVHGNAVPSGTGPTVTSVDVTALQYLFGWTGSLDLTGAGVSAMADRKGDTPDILLLVKLTPSGGAAENVLLLPINLST